MSRMESSTALDTTDSKILEIDFAKWNNAFKSSSSESHISTPDTQADIEDMILDLLEAMERKHMKKIMSKSPYPAFPKLAYFLEVCYSTTSQRTQFQP